MEYRVDPDAVDAVAVSLSVAADSAPAATLPGGHGCGSAAVESTLNETGAVFRRSWQALLRRALDLATGAVHAAASYRESESKVMAEAEALEK